MSLDLIVKAGNVIETLENYSVNADITEEDDSISESAAPSFYSDEDFWTSFLKNPELFWNKKLSLYNVTLVNWVGRVPGLYWTDNAARYRSASAEKPAYISEAWKVYPPNLKSGFVMGGIGDFILPPAENGTTIMTVSYTNNATTGIPVLIFPEVIEHHHLEQGDHLQIKNATWRKMSLEWSSRFQSFGDLKRGYLVIDNPDQIVVFERNHPVIFHPCTLMEYTAESGTRMYDYVFCTADSMVENYRQRLIDFFETYKNDKERYGKYLLAADANDPLFEAYYNSPLDLQQAMPDGRTQLTLIRERVQNTFYHKGETIDSLLKVLPKYYSTSLKVFALAQRLTIPLALIGESTGDKMCARLVEICIERKILETLVDVLMTDYPETINQ